MADALENAYLVLLGQIALIATAVFFGVPYFLSLPADERLAANAVTIFYLVFVFCACALMIANIIIGWAALRGATKKPNYYTSKMFVIDLVIIVVFFAMNNVIMFSFGDTLSFQDTDTVASVIEKGVSLVTISYMGSALYFLTAAFLALCKAWNWAYYEVSDVKDVTLYERCMWAVIAYCLFACVVSAMSTQFLMVQIILFALWGACWIFINGHWIVKDFLAATTNDDGGVG